MAGDSTDCYIDIWKKKHFEGPRLRIEGPAEYSHLRFGDDEWGDQIGSLKVGPSAFVMAYEDRDFKDRMISFGPGQAVADLSQMHFDNEIDSVKIIDSIKIFYRRSQVSDDANTMKSAAVTISRKPSIRPRPVRFKRRRGQRKR